MTNFSLFFYGKECTLIQFVIMISINDQSYLNKYFGTWPNYVARDACTKTMTKSLTHYNRACSKVNILLIYLHSRYVMNLALRLLFSHFLLLFSHFLFMILLSLFLFLLVGFFMLLVFLLLLFL